MDGWVKPGHDEASPLCPAFMARPLPVYEILMAQQAAKARCYARNRTSLASRRMTWWNDMPKWWCCAMGLATGATLGLLVASVVAD